MSGKSPVTVTTEQRAALDALSASHERGGADRARAILLTVAGWTSAGTAEAFGVREDTVRFWPSTFLDTGADGPRRQVSSGPEPVKADAALRAADDVLPLPVTDPANWTLPRLVEEIGRREGVRMSKSRLSTVLRKRGAAASAGLATR